MEAGAKGTVTSLSSLFPAEDAHKAAKRVQDTLSEKQKELDCLRGFISDNTNLINLVQKLPEELSHDVMVPFGKAAFFPGRLIHTNEFLVLLGEGYYAERTSKQTVEILKRRGKSLDSQVDSLKAMMDDLKVEASFFYATASEAAEGLVEIKEYVEEDSSEQESESGINKQIGSDFPSVDTARIAEEDEEYARIMSRLDELEREEELAAGSDSKSDVDEEWNATSDKSLEKLHDDKHGYSESRMTPCQREENIGSEVLPLMHQQQQQQEVSTNPSNHRDFSIRSVSRDNTSHDNSLTHQVKGPNSAVKSVTFAEVGEKDQTWPSSTSEVSNQRSIPAFDSHKAFTGSIIERSPIIHKNSKKETETPSQSSSSQPSKPVSRFKMQRR